MVLASVPSLFSSQMKLGLLTKEHTHTGLEQEHKPDHLHLFYLICVLKILWRRLILNIYGQT